MEIKAIEMQAFRITGVKGLDPVTVIFRDEGPGQGTLVVECYGRAWYCFFPGMGSVGGIVEFIGKCDIDYLCGKLCDKKQTRMESEYLKRVVQTVINGAKYAELEVAQRNGAVIQLLLNSDEYGPDRWSDKQSEGWALSPERYRIKPEAEN